jgi:hypothetical protein
MAGSAGADASPQGPLLIEAAVNGGRRRHEHAAIPYSPAEVAEEARRCAEAGAGLVHFHARSPDGGWSADVGWYADAVRRIRALAPGLLVSLTSLRPAGVPVAAVLNLLATLAADPATMPISSRSTSGISPPGSPRPRPTARDAAPATTRTTTKTSSHSSGSAARSASSPSSA